MKFVIWIIIVAYELWIVRNCVHVMHIILWMIAHEYHRHATHRLWEHINYCSGARFSVAVYINGFVWIWCRFVPVLDYTCIFASLPQSLDFFSGPLNSRFSIHWNSNFHIFLCVCSLYFPAFLLHVNKTLVHSQEAHDVLICRVNKGTEPNVIKISSYVCLTCIDNVEIEL